VVAEYLRVLAGVVATGGEIARSVGAVGDEIEARVGAPNGAGS
jgi:hypothetical protein